jgi:hypothetical protein
MDAQDYDIILVADGKSGLIDLEVRIACTFGEAFELWKVKQQKYGPHNIAQLGRAGVLDRMMSDKGQRLKRFIYEQAPEDGDDAEEDAWLDCINYSAMGLMLYRNQWPGAVRDKVTFAQLLFTLKGFIKGVFNHG